MKKVPWYVYAIMGLVLTGFVVYVVLRFMGKGPTDVTRYRIVANAKKVILENELVRKALKDKLGKDLQRKEQLENQIDSILNSFF